MFLKHKVWPSLAHPYQYGLSNANLQELISTLCAEGLRGIEVWHSSHHYADSSRLLAIARVNHLVPTGGTDFHGSNSAHPRPVGTCTASDDAIEQLRALAQQYHQSK